jgi:hypothetical protein
LTKPFLFTVSGYGSDFALFPEFYGTINGWLQPFVWKKRLEN